MNFYRLDDEILYNFFMMPKILFSDNYKTLSLEAKIAFMLIIDRLKLSKINAWVNENKELYVLYNREELAQQLGVCQKTIVKILKELKEYKLLYEKRQGQGKPNIIYIAKIEEIQKIQNEKCKKYNSKNVDNIITEDEKNTNQKEQKLQANNNNINNNKYNNNSVSQYDEDIEILEQIKRKCELNYLLTTDEYRMKPIIENILEIMYFSKEIKINNAILPQSLIRAKMQGLNGGITMYFIQKLNQLGNNGELDIKNSTNFLITCLYNCITEYYSDSELMFKIEFKS